MTLIGQRHNQSLLFMKAGCQHALFGVVECIQDSGMYSLVSLYMELGARLGSSPFLPARRQDGHTL